MKKTKMEQEIKLKEKLNPTKLKIYERELSKIEEKNEGVLTPREILREARKENSPLHDFFDWDDTEAAQKWRIWQARFLITTIKVKINYEGNVKEYRKYLNVKLNENQVSQKESSRGYVQTQVIVGSPNLKKQILARALREAEYWQNSYRDYNELEGIFDSIKKTKKKLKKVIELDA